MTPPLPSGTGLNDLLVVWDAACLRHDPGGEVWLGQRDTGTEVAERARVLLAAVQAEGARVVSAEPHGDEVLTAVHSPELVGHLRTVWADLWSRAHEIFDAGCCSTRAVFFEV